MMASVQPVFVYDGSRRPPVKRDRYVPRTSSFTAYPAAAASSLRTNEDVDKEYEIRHIIALSRQVLDHLGVPWLEAPGEAEAECVALEKAGVVDAISTKDGDALAFGGATVLLPENKTTHKGRTVLPVCEFTAEAIKREDLVLLALMAGGDYDHGILGCGPMLAMAAARAGYGKELFAYIQSGIFVPRKLAAWRNKLKAELETNSHKRLGGIHRGVAANMPDDFPKQEILDLYLHPAVSSAEQLQHLKSTIAWTPPINIVTLREFTRVNFDWKGFNFAKKFISVLCSPLLARELLRHSENGNDATGIFECIKNGRDAVAGESPEEVRLEFIPHHVVGTDWQAEPKLMGYSTQFDKNDEYDPNKPDRAWCPAFLVKRGTPVQYESWKNETKKSGQTPGKRSQSAFNAEHTQPAKRQRGRPRKIAPDPTADAGNAKSSVVPDDRDNTPLGPATVKDRPPQATNPLSSQSNMAGTKRKLQLLRPIEEIMAERLASSTESGPQKLAASPLDSDKTLENTSRTDSGRIPPFHPLSASYANDGDDDVIILDSRPVNNSSFSWAFPYLNDAITEDTSRKHDRLSVSQLGSPSAPNQAPVNNLPSTKPSKSRASDKGSRGRKKARALNNSAYIT